MSDLSPDHPRYESLRIRNLITAGVEAGITSVHGLVAHGRGEAFDYLLGEQSHDFARSAVRAAAVLLVSADRPVVSVNGNAAALVPAELAELARVVEAPLEVNIFHASADREQVIRRHLLEHGAQSVLKPTREAELDFISSNRRFVHPEGILVADVVFVPLEDGDRCQALRRMGKQVVTVDLNPLSRTAALASVTIVDNVVRALPLLLEAVGQLVSGGAERETATSYDNDSIRATAIACIRAA